jgi:hypothetical protein
LAFTVGAPPISGPLSPHRTLRPDLEIARRALASDTGSQFAGRGATTRRLDDRLPVAAPSASNPDLFGKAV